MAFLSDLTEQLFSVGENKTHNFNTEDDGKYGALNSDFRKVLDQTAERSYVEEGYIRKDVVNLDSKQREILMQEPQATVFVKKRMFSSVAENYRPDFMDYDERLYFRTCKFLFQNKCTQIAALEKLSKIQKIISSTNSVDDQMISLIFMLSDMFASSGSLDKSEVNQFTSTMQRLRKINSYNKSAKLTTWITNAKDILKSQLGQGTGVIEITNFASLNTTVTNSLSSKGNLSLRIEDPYECMVISESDIEKAISDASNMFYGSKTYLMSLNMSEELIQSLTRRLNAVRKARNASPISFKINPDTILGRRITAIIDRTGQEIQFEFDYIKSITSEGTSVSKDYYRGGIIAGDEGLDDKRTRRSLVEYDLGVDLFKIEPELDLFKKLVDALYNKLAIEINSRNGLQIKNAKTNYARKKLRFNFLGKLVIQPMDTIHVYISSKSSYDTKVLSGLKSSFNTVGAIQSVMSGLTELKKQFQLVFNPNALNVAVERAIFAGEEFSPYLWSLMRSQFVNENEGVHVFGGIVSDASGSYQASAGKFTVNVNANDNSEYLSMGKIIEKPGVDNWNGKIYDPLTPFKNKFDAVSYNSNKDIPDLLNENQIILGDPSNQEILVKYNQGPFAGKPAYNNNYISEKVSEGGTNEINKIIYAPNGLVYKWKEGIGVYTWGGSNFNFDTNSSTGIPRMSEEAFAGQDVMNVISMLITGQPYNFATYFSTISNWDGISKDPYDSQTSSNSYYTALRNDLQKRNTIWGNFIPFKNLTIDEQTYVKTYRSFAQFKEKEAYIESKLNDLAELERKNLLLGYGHAFDQSIYKEPQAIKDQQALVVSKAKKIKEEIDESLAALDVANQNEYFIESGSDIIFNFDKFLESSDGSKILDSPEARRFIRRQINFLTRRMSYDVRANEDKNLFIVDDFYDKDYDLAAFTSQLQNMQNFNSSLLDVKGKIISVAELLGLEVFCDTQGHIRVRSPQYNRMPSSIFYKMMYQKRTMNIQVFPEFMNQLFTTQLDSLKNRLEIIEDEIRLYAGILGKKTDQEICDFISSAPESSGKSISQPFSFISKVNDNGIEVGIPDLIKLQQADPTSADNLKIQNQAKNSSSLFSSRARFDFLFKTIKNAENKSSFNPYNILEDIDDNEKYINNIILRIKRKSGQEIKKQYFYRSYPEPFAKSVKPSSKDIDIFKIVKDLSQKIAERQKVLKLFYSSLKNSMEFKYLDEDDKEKNTLMLFGTYGNKNTPEVFEHLIEDESYDDLGPGSGKRYIIKNSQIISYDIKESAPDFTTVQVSGTFNPMDPKNDLGFQPFAESGGNGLVTAIAVDYDLWRNYGWKASSPINAPFLNDKDAQCAPYAAAILSRARKKTISGSIVIVGNEYMQPGEVIYLEARSMLFYVESVSHNFSWNKFTTSLKLSYGHVPGEYIPNTLDVIGKLIYKNKDIVNYEVRKQFNCFNEEDRGVLIFDKNKKGDKPGQYDENNLKVMKNLLNTSASLLAYTNAKENLKATIQLRIYFNSKKGNINPQLKDFAENIRDILIGNKEDNFLQMKNSKGNLIKIDEKNIDPIIIVDLSAEDDYKTPSQNAWNVVRSLVEKTKSSETVAVDKSGEDKDEKEITKAKISKERKKIQNFLFTHIVDCFIKIENK